MSRYAPLFSIAIEHEYFQSRATPGVRCVSDPQSAALGRACGLVVKADAERATVYFDLSNREALDMAIADKRMPACLWFRLLIDNPVVHHCTATKMPKAGSTFFFSNAARSEQAEGQAQSLAVHDEVSASDVVALNDERLAPALTTRDRLQSPFGLVCISLDDLLAPSDTPVTTDFVIRFAARETHWKYYLVANMPTQQLEVKAGEHDSAGVPSAIEFTRRTEVLPDGRECDTFTSTSSIALRERSTQKIELRNLQTDTAVIDRLPVATPQKLSKDTLDGRETYVSDIFVNL